MKESAYYIHVPLATGGVGKNDIGSECIHQGQPGPMLAAVNK
tara:strand:- start:889 stop:1014 length:126 start_codon:yes stop_codon:yes gene_type:complete